MRLNNLTLPSVRMLLGVFIALMAWVILFAVAAPYAHAQTPTNTGTELSCNAITTCFAVVIYWIGPGLASKVAAVGAYFFSMMIGMSLNSTAYALQFLTDGWTMVRDLANMAFIFILIYIAMVVMLEAETAGTIKTLAVVIVIALLVNFSFFFTRVVIDTGNILAIQFYNAIDRVQDPANGKDGLISGTGFKDLSISVMGAGQVQTLLSQQLFSNISGNADNSVVSGGSWAALGVFTVIYFAVAAFFWMLFFAFIQVGIKFLLRIVALWFLLMASPLAFVARTMHNTEGYFKKWLTLLIQYALYPAIFMFMFLMLTRFSSAIMTSGVSGGGGIFNGISDSILSAKGAGADTYSVVIAAIASVGIRMGFLIALLYVSLRVADWVCTETSSLAATVSGAAGAGMGKVVQAGAAGSAWTARQTVGRGAYAASRSQLVNRFAARSSLGTALKGTLASVGSAQLDVRNAPGSGLLGKGAELAYGSKIDVGTPGGKGGFAKSVENRKKQIEERAKAFKGDAVDVRKAKKAAIAAFDKENGAGAYNDRIAKLAQQINNAKKLESSYTAKAAKTGGATSARYQAAAQDAKTMAEKASKELADIQKKTDGSAIVKANEKALAQRLAQRYGTRNLGNLGMPSRGSILGAAAAEKVAKGKSQEEELIEHIKHLSHGDHKEEEKHADAKPAAKPAAAPKAAAPKDDHGHGDAHH